MILIRRIEGNSMLPSFPAGRVIVATKRIKQLRPGDIVIFMHDGLEKIKQIQQIQGDKLYVRGLNTLHSTDSRHFGWIDKDAVIARVLSARTDMYPA